MKQTLIHLFVSAFTAVFLVAACEPKEEVFPEIEINPAEIVLTSDGGSRFLCADPRFRPLPQGDKA